MAPKAERPDMAGYGVTEDPKGLLAWSWAEERLRNSRNYWLTTVSREGRPHSMPIWGIWLSDRERFWFSAAATSRKVRNLSQDPRAVVAPSDAVEVVSVEGRAIETTGGNIEIAVGEYWRKYGDEMGMTKEQTDEFLGSNASFEIVPDRAFGIIERPEEFSTRATRWSWPSG